MEFRLTQDDRPLEQLLESFVWTDACQIMGRPSTDLLEYFERSRVKIAAWQEEAENEKLTRHEKVKIKNKIAALKSRMGCK